VPAPPEPIEVRPYRPERHVGRYERAGVRFDISVRPPGLLLTSTETSGFAELSPDPEVNEYELLPLDESGDRYGFREHAGQPWATVTFDRLTDGTPYVFVGARTTPKTDA
jgi:hypothetical protein